MKKIFSIVCLCIVCALSPLAADADPYKGTKGLEYEFRHEWKVAWVNGRGTARGSNIVVPQLIRVDGEDYRVNQINERAFAHDTQLKSIVFPEGLDNIGWAAFDSCVNLTNCVLPNTIKTVNGYAFYNCAKLTSINIPDSMEFAARGAFQGTGISTPLYNDKCFMYMPPSFKGTYEIKEGTQSIGGGAFENCEKLYAIKIPQSVTWIGDCAFVSCTSLTDLVIPDSIKWSGGYICAGCSSLRSVKLPKGMTAIPDGMFIDCINLQSIDMPNMITYIGDDAFDNCKKLSNITLKEGLKEIGNFAFSECENLNQIILPNSVEHVGDGAFGGCRRFTKPVFNKTIFAYLHPSYTGKYVVKEGIKEIAGWAFVDAEELTSLQIPNSVVVLGDAACASDVLSSPVYNKHIFAFMPDDYKGAYVIPDGIKVIGASAFRFCKQMTSITIPESVTEIGSKAFAECYSLRNVVIPSSVTKLAEDAFPSSCRLIRK